MRHFIIICLIFSQACAGSLHTSSLDSSLRHHDDWATAIALFEQEGYTLDLHYILEVDAPYLEKSFSKKLTGHFDFTSKMVRVAIDRPLIDVRSTIVHELTHVAQWEKHEEHIRAMAWGQREWHAHAGYFDGAVKGVECSSDNDTLFCRVWRATGWGE